MDHEHAYGLLFERRRPLTWVWRWLRRLGVARRDRADVRQAVFLEARRRWHTFDPTRARPECWLNAITVHLAARHNARAVHRREVLTSRAFANVASSERGPEGQLAAEERRRMLFEMLDLLHPSDRSVIIAHDIDEIPMVTIAAHVGMPLSTLYKWRTRGLADLRVLLTEAYR